MAMKKFNASRTELLERIEIAVTESRKKHLTGDKQIDYIAGRMWELGEIGYGVYADNRKKQDTATERMNAAMGIAASVKAKTTTKAKKPTATNAKTAKAKTATATAKTATNATKEASKA